MSSAQEECFFHLRTAVRKWVPSDPPKESLAAVKCYFHLSEAVRKWVPCDPPEATPPPTRVDPEVQQRERIAIGKMDH